MSDRIPALLEPIQNRLNAATPGPWEAYDANEGEWPPRPMWCVANEAFHNPSNDDEPWLAVEVHTGCKEDADFIASAPMDQARLLAAVQAGTSILDERARELRETADRLNQQVIDRDLDRDIEAAQRYSHYAAQAEAAAYAHRVAVVAALGGEA